MPNALYGNVLYADTVGILSKIPLRLRAIQFYPNAVSDVVDLNFWDEANPLASSELELTATASTGTVTDDNAGHNWLTSASFPDGAVVKVLKTSGAAGNKTYHLVGTAGNNDRIIITPTATWADEANIQYHIIAYPARPVFNALQPTVATTQESKFHYLGDLWVPNLVLETISTSAYALIYLV